MTSFKIHNLKENQMYFKNIGLLFHIFQTNKKINKFIKKKIFTKIIIFFFLNKTLKLSIQLQNLISPMMEKDFNDPAVQMEGRSTMENDTQVDILNVVECKMR